MKPKPGRKWRHPKPTPSWLRPKDKDEKKQEAKPPTKDK